MIISAYQPDAISQSEIMKMKKLYVDASNLLQTEDSYKINYYKILSFGMLSNIFLVFGVLVDADIQTYLEKYFEASKLTYVRLITSFENCISTDLEEPLRKCLQYLDELEAHELCQLRLTVKYQLIVLQ